MDEQIVDENNLRSMPWKPLTNWKVSTSYLCWSGEYASTEEDVDVFVENVYREVARQLDMEYDSVRRVLKSENQAFYRLKEQIFKRTSKLTKGNTHLNDLMSTLRIPDTCAIKDSNNKVDNCLKMFNRLSNIEKVTFLEKIGKIKIRIEKTE